MRTVGYNAFRDRFTSAIGVDTLLTAEETALKRSLTDRVRGAWIRSKWPELLNVVTKTVAAVSSGTLKADRAVQIDNAADLFDVYAVWDKVPWEDDTARQISYSLIGGYLVLPADTSETTVYVVGSKVPSDDYGGSETNIPQFLERHLLAACIADYYVADGQNDKAQLENATAEEYLMQEIDRVERLQQQNRIVINSYPALWPTPLITQTTV
tara:strand:+ start:1698 stop:2333 length:636 start_codon:yes stop_codon:yes gene_type:complete